VNIECQTHAIEQWRAEGPQIIAAKRYAREFPLKATDVLAFAFGDPKEQLAKLTAHIEAVKKKSASYMAEVNDDFQLLLKVLVFVEEVLRPTPAKAPPIKKKAA